MKAVLRKLIETLRKKNKRYAFCIKIVCHYHIETIGLIPKISVLFSFYRAVSLILGINCLIFCEVALFSLPVLKAGNLSKARTGNKKHELTIKSTNIP